MVLLDIRPEKRKGIALDLYGRRIFRERALGRRVNGVSVWERLVELFVYDRQVPIQDIRSFSRCREIEAERVDAQIMRPADGHHVIGDRYVLSRYGRNRQHTNRRWPYKQHPE